MSHVVEKRKVIVIKLNWNKKYTTIAVYSLLVIVAAVLFVVFIFKFESFASGFSWLGSVMAPITIGIVVAYILNPLVKMFEERVFRKLRDESRVVPNKNKKDPEKHAEKRIHRRKTAAKAFSIIISFIIVLAVIVGMCIAIVPNVAKSVVDLAEQMPTYIEKADAFLEETFANNPALADSIADEFKQISGIFQEFVKLMEPMSSDIIGNVGTGLVEIVSAVLVALKNVLIGFVIAIYFLFSKDRLIAQTKKMMFALLKNDKCQSILSVCSKSNSIFTKYIVSNLLDALIIFAAMAVAMAIMDMPYAMLVSVVCGVTNLIPFFGPFIGAIPCGLLILLVDPIKVLWFGLFVLVLQQMDGNVIKPLLFGETVGLPAIWVLIAIIVSGGLFGIPGMLLGVPVFAVIYMLVAEFAAARLKKKNMPVDTDRYLDTLEYDMDYKEPDPENGPTPSE